MGTQLVELIKQWREGTGGYKEQVGYARGSDFAFRKCADDLEKALTRIDAERGKSATAWETVTRNGSHMLSYEPVVLSEYYVAQSPLFLSPTIPEGMAMVPIEQRNDAARYAWLRNPDQNVSLVLDKVVGSTPVDEQGFGGYRNYEYRAGSELDEAIDEAMLAAADIAAHKKGVPQ